MDFQEKYLKSSLYFLLQLHPFAFATTGHFIICCLVHTNDFLYDDMVKKVVILIYRKTCGGKTVYENRMYN
jgi:hypothetical protein